MTEYHNYNTPTEGTTNWHEPLNENFEQIDNDIEVRDTESNRSQYPARTGAKFLSTDTGRRFVGADSQWERVPSGSHASLLRDGYIVAGSHGAHIEIDPTGSEYDDAGEALQAANDALLEEMDEGSYGLLYFPSEDREGNRLVVSSTVSLGNTGDKTILPHGWGFGDPATGIDCRIDDGSPMFHVLGDIDGDSVTSVQGTPFGCFHADANGYDAEFIRLSNINAFTLLNTVGRHFNTTTAAGVYVFDGACYNSYINNTGYIQTWIDCPDTDVWTMVDDTGDGPPGELKFGTGNSTYADPSKPFNTAYRQTVDAPGIVFNGRVEGAAGTAMIYVTDGYFSSSCMEMGRVEGTDTHKLYFGGDKLSIGTSVQSKPSNETGGDTIHVTGDAQQVRISSFLDADPSPGHSVNIAGDGGGNNVFVVPYENTLWGSVSYPSEPWAATRYADGWQRLRSGTTTIEANGTTFLTSWAGGPGTEISLTNLAIDADPGADVEFQKVFGWREATGSDGQQTVKIKETAGNSFDLSWDLYRRGD